MKGKGFPSLRSVAAKEMQREYPDSPQIAVGAIVIRDNRVLACQEGTATQ